MDLQSTGSALYYSQYWYDYSDGYRRYLKQYTASATVSVELEEIKGEVLDGVQNVRGATVENLSKKEIYEVLVEAQKEAVKNAENNSQKNGEKMLEGVGDTLGKLLYAESYKNDYLQQGGGSLQVVRATATVTYEIVGKEEMGES